MNEIEKMYKNTGIIKKRECSYPNGVCKRGDFIPCELCAIKADMIYPPFTAEKQIEILKLILKKRRILDVGYIIEQEKYDCMHYKRVFDSFEEALCADVNYHWQNLTEEEKEAIRGILRA